MNTVQLVGRLARDVDIKYADSGTAVARFSVACDRRFKKDGEESCDFISCVAFGKIAEFVEKYFTKGQRIGLTGRIQTGSYVGQDNKKVYTTDIVVENVEFVESKGNAQGSGGFKPEPSNAIGDGFMNIPDGVEDEGLPFN